MFMRQSDLAAYLKLFDRIDNLNNAKNENEEKAKAYPLIPHQATLEKLQMARSGLLRELAECYRSIFHYENGFDIMSLVLSLQFYEMAIETLKQIGKTPSLYLVLCHEAAEKEIEFYVSDQAENYKKTISEFRDPQRNPDQMMIFRAISSSRPFLFEQTKKKARLLMPQAKQPEPIETEELEETETKDVNMEIENNENLSTNTWSFNF